MKNNAIDTGISRTQWISLGVFLLAIAVVTVVFFRGLGRDPQALDLMTAGKPIPDFSLPNLLAESHLSRADLTTDQGFYLMNFWGSWCPACYDEHTFLMALGKKHALYGVNWKDDKADALAFLQNLGNPFKQIIVDKHSELAINMGVYGAPETFLITADGVIIHRYAGPLDDALWQSEFVPIINQLETN
ncbi:DsbE family thiol:disulfide interchange protein [Ostreibacterium oceani]|uniref:DsbE family thiol:disulfide interchange protein n=1 Tax=Ostreibacterium oceani TaxID=2654998 RepID=A0A6N7EUB2_9GAMM|nr:DsbE family thiol:disulfide interchange protein [Ostreibacterium oceani]MPV86022.1 DsbE family thiol:disulfide interchange protein [Ostreibacterium oceani]